MGSNQKWSVWPLVYFKADFPGDVIEHFDLGIKLIRADDPTGVDTNVTTLYSCSNPTFINKLRFESEWLLAIQLPEAMEHISPHKVGMSFIDEVEKVIVDSFLLCLKVIKPMSIAYPYKFVFNKCNDLLNIHELLEAEADNYDGFDLFEDSHIPEKILNVDYRYTADDLSVLTSLWSSVCLLRKLDQWSHIAFSEKFFARIDQQASMATEKKSKDFEKKLLELGFSFDSDSFKDSFFTGSFPNEFKKNKDNFMFNRTRIGRALSIFSDGIELPDLHSFLSMCLVLETLFTEGYGEVTHKLATRFSKIISNGNREIKVDLFKRVKELYNTRSKVVHGSQLVDMIDKKTWKEAFTLVCMALHFVLTDLNVLVKFSDKDSVDNLKGDKDKVLKNFF